MISNVSNVSKVHLFFCFFLDTRNDVRQIQHLFLPFVFLRSKLGIDFVYALLLCFVVEDFMTA